MFRQMMDNITAGVVPPCSELELPMEIARTISELVHRLQNRLDEGTYRELVDDLVRREGISHLSLSGGDTINVIPGQQRLACTRITLAVSTGASPTGPLGFQSVMRAVREHMIDCERMTKAVILLTDTWSPRHIDEHIRDIHAHSRHGRFVVPHLVTGSRILRLDWPIE